MTEITRPKIAIALEYPLSIQGGVSVLVKQLIQGLSSQYNIVFVSPDGPGDVFIHSISDHIRWDPKAVSRKNSQALAERLAELGVQLAHFHSGGNYGWGARIPGQSPIPFLARRGIVCVSTIHLVVSILDGYCEAKKPLWFKLALLPLAWLGKMHTLRHLKAEIAVSKHDAALVRRWYWPLGGRFRQIYHSRIHVDSALVPPAHFARELFILSVGHIAYRKGQHTLAAAFAKIAGKHPEWKLLIVGPVGDKDCEREIVQSIAAARLEKRIILAGNRNDAQALMQRAAIFVQPSVWEALGLALQEALFAGCACIATSAGGIPELIDHEVNGLLVNVADVEDLAAALDRLICDRALREKFSARACESVLRKKMTAPQMIARHIELYKEIFKQNVFYD